MISPAMLASAVAELMALPRLDWSEDRTHGVTGTATGTDRQIRADVWEWALAFGLKPAVVSPAASYLDGHRYPTTGWIVVELPVLGAGVTVAGRLTGSRREAP